MGMGVVRGLGRWAGTGLWVIVLAPGVSLVAAAVVDRGPRGEVRFASFPLALATLDPFLWDCTRNSVAVALGAALGSLVLGTGLARIRSRWRFWGRPVLTALMIAPLVIPPGFGAMGLRRLLEQGQWAGVAGAYGVWAAVGVRWGWIAWVWVALSAGIPVVALATTSALAGIDPEWEDAARLAGASERRIWWQFVWPCVRPAAARAAGLVFGLTLLEPGAPLVLGLRRTLAFQVVDAAIGPAPFPRAAVLAVEAAALALVVRGLLRWWGRPSRTYAPSTATAPLAPVAKPAAWPRTVVYAVLLGAAILWAWLPLAALLVPGSPGSAGTSLRRVGMTDQETGRVLLNSMGLGLAALGIDLALGWTLTAWAGRRHAWILSLAAWPELLPPLALGVGALGLTELLGLAAASAGGGNGGGLLAHPARVLAALLDPYRNPGVVLALSVAAARLPYLARAVEQGWSRSRPAQVDAAYLVGASPRQARRTARGLWLGAAPSALILTFALAATNLAPALVLAPTIESRPIAPQVLVLADLPGGGFEPAARLALLAIAVNLAALGFAALDPTLGLKGRPRE